MTHLREPSRLASAADAAEVARLIDRFNAEYDEYTPGAEVLEPRVVEHIERDLSVFLLAGPPDTGVAQLRFREYLLTGKPMVYLEELYVVPDRRGEGHGRAADGGGDSRWPANEGPPRWSSGTATNDRAARGLYESLGFTNLEKPGDPETSMLYYEREL